MNKPFRHTCRELRKQNLTLSEIVDRTGRPKTSVYFHIRDLPLPTIRREQIHKESGARIGAYSRSRKGKSTREFKAFYIWTPEKVLLVSHLLFDGEISKGRCIYNNRSDELLQRFELLMKDLYSYPPKRYVNNSTGVKRIAYFNVALGEYLKGKSHELLKGIPTLPVECRKEFLRAFFDDEGCMDYRPHRGLRRVRGYQKSPSTLILVQALLSGIGVESHIQLPNEIYISGREPLMLFQREIGFSAGVRINGKRSNSLWKASIEKRALLAQAIDSYRS